MQHEIIQYYDGVAQEYDRKYDWSGTDIEALSHFADTLSDSNITTLMDIGCGPAKAAVFFAERNYTVIAVDGSEQMLEVARRERPHPNISYICQTLEEILEKGESLGPTGILLLFTLIHYNKDQVLTLLHRIYNLFPPGSVILLASQLGETQRIVSPITNRELPVYCWGRDELDSNIEKLGYKIIHCSTREPRATELQRHKYFLEIKI